MSSSQSSRTDTRPIALPTRLVRGLVVQSLGLGLVVLMGLTVISWPFVLAWTAALVAVLAAERRVLRLGAGDDPSAVTGTPLALALRVAGASLYALAALNLLLRGGEGHHLFAFALISASTMQVLIRHYRSPRIVVAGIAPHLFVLGIVGVRMTRAALEQGWGLGAAAAGLAMVLFAAQVWSVRAQLAGA